ncbi:Uncharacterised protein [Mycobacteroides abscessus subsp. massiliense]|nr:hypothetical protein BAB74_12510 [Mycobacteroides abscessus]SKH34855.1 Uncharacterised protein [Mycobacteroides abscessus subsp. bolletii]SKT22170.1 Uncharacterised protein [Mycobacteroides abscessus subsp. abscessus]SLE44460.1 Uncharacterised protein [Mycobacteroides abscessus subsp. massiliense]SKU41919.1 Uncharacterised protein [Mycobacteroides abscessus subsp. bolletii]
MPVISGGFGAAYRITIVAINQGIQRGGDPFDRPALPAGERGDDRCIQRCHDFVLDQLGPSDDQRDGAKVDVTGSKSISYAT